MHARVCTILALLGAGLTPRAELAAQQRPALVVQLTVDQLAARYIDRFAPQFTGGFRRLLDGGTHYVTALQDHAMTATAPGHATLWSGRFPAHTNILSNDFGVPDSTSPLIGGLSGPGASPHRFRGTALADWLVRADANTRVLSLSRKDRGAILPVGAMRTNVFWWSNDGGFTTSRFYADTLPAWVRDWNANTRARAAQWTGREWTLLLPEASYPEPDSAAWEGVSGRRGSTFPHRVRNIADLEQFPWIDSLTLDMALTGARQLQLGRRGITDLLSVSVSALDFIGHDFGPDSREVHDHILRLDRWLGDFLTSLDRDLAARGGVLVILSADHGVLTMPEVLAMRGERTGRGVSISTAVRVVMMPLQQQHGTDFDVLLQTGLLLADTAALRARGLDVAQLAEQLAARVRALPGIVRVYTPASLARAGDDEAGPWHRTIPPGYGWLIAAEPDPNWGTGRTPGGEHGTPARLNMEVPLFFHGPGIRQERVTRVVRTVDIAPTVAALLGIRPTEAVDGVVLREVVVR